IEFCCNFYNEHAPEDKIWFGRMFDDCHEEHNKRNSSMYRWQFPLRVLKEQQAIIDQLNSVLEERTKEWLQAIELGTYFENVAKPLKEENDRLKAQLNDMEVCYIQVKKERDELQGRIDEISTYATELAEYASYAEIIGSVSHNRSAIREYCDKVFAYNRAIDIEEEKALRGAND